MSPGLASGRHARRFSIVACLATLSLLATASPTSASVTVGQTQPTSLTCTPGYDWTQPTVTSGNTFVVPPTVVTGTITSWSTTANANGGELTMKIFRHVAGSTYMAVGHDGPRSLNPNVPNTFTGINVPVKAGDLLGLHAGAGDTGCLLDAPGDEGHYYFGDLLEGQSGDFAPDAGQNNRINITAVVDPSNSFTLDVIKRNKKKGTATVTVNTPNPGELTGSGKGIKVASAAVTSKAVTAPGTATLTIKAKKKKKRKLNESGKVKVEATITYTPSGGDPSSQSIKVKLKKKV